MRTSPLKFIGLACLFVLAIIQWYIMRMEPNPRYGKVFYALGRECEENGCATNTQVYYFKRAVFYDPNLSDAYYRLGKIYGRNGQHGKEIEFYQKAGQLDHTNAEVYFQMGLDHFQKGELDHAIRCLLQSDRRKPSSPDTFYYLARAYDEKGMYKEAAYYYVTLLVWGSPRSAEVCQRIWSISKIPGQFPVVTGQLMMLRHAPQYDLWEQIDAYLKTDRVPEFMRGWGHE